MKVIYWMPHGRVVGAEPPGVAGLLSKNMIPQFLARGIDMIACCAGTKIDVPCFTGSLPECIQKFKPDLVYNLVAETHLGGVETYLQQAKVKYVGDATHGKFIPELTMHNFDFICQSRLLYTRLVERGFKAHLIRTYVPTSAIASIEQMDYTGKPPSYTLLYMHNGDKGIGTSLEVAERTQMHMMVTIAQLPRASKYVSRVGCVNDLAKAKLITTCDALVYTPPSDGFIEATCTSAIESLMAGLPIVGVPNNFGHGMCVFQYLEEGNIPSIVRDTPQALIDAICAGELRKIDRNQVREQSRKYFKSDVDEFIQVFERVLGS